MTPLRTSYFARHLGIRAMVLAGLPQSNSKYVYITRGHLDLLMEKLQNCVKQTEI